MSAVDEGTTNVGTITGRLRLDASQWNRQLAAAEKKARELGTVDPTIKVDVNAADALAKLAAVDAAEEKLSGTTDRVTKSVIKANDANKTNVSRLGLIAAAVVTLIPMLGPLAGYAFGVAGALGAMGAAGILAVVGIKHAIEQNTAAGQEYAAGLQILKSGLNGLADTAAAGMLANFHIAVGQINSAMPMLNSQVGTFSRQLGTTGNLVLAGVINGFRVLNPLFLTAGLYVQQLAAGFAGWTGNGGLQRFGDYAMQMLPRVAETLGVLAQMAVNLIVALSPMGTVVLGALQGIANILNFIMTVAGPAFAPLVGGALAAVGAFKLWGFVAPMLQGVATAMGAVGVATTIATGPIGWVAAAVAGLAAVFAISTVLMEDNTEAATGYAAALQQDVGAIGAATRAQAAKNLQDAGAFEAGKKLGLSSEIIVNAALGQKDAIEQVNRAMQEQGGLIPGLTAAQQGWGDGSGNLTDKQWELLHASEELSGGLDTQKSLLGEEIAKYNELQGAIGGTTALTRGQLNAQQALADEYGVSLGAYQSATGANKQTEDQLALTTAQMRLQNDAAGLLNNALTILNGGALDVAQAQTGVASANNALTDSFDRNGLAINGVTKEAVANQQALQQQVDAAQRVADAVATQTGSSEAAIQSYKDQKTALEDQLRAQGDLNPEVQAYIDKLYDIKNLKIPPTQLDIDNSSALAKIAQVQKALDGLDMIKSGLSVDSKGNLHYSDSRNTHFDGHAAGGTVGGAGSGTSDSNLIWASRGEEITKAGSASVPGVRPLLKAINQDPAGTMNRLAKATGSAEQAPPQVINNYYTINAADMNEVMLSHAIANRQKAVAA